MEEIKNRFVAITGHVNGAPLESDFEIITETICWPTEKDAVEVIVRNLYVSVDPYQLNRMKARSSSQTAISYASAVAPGQVDLLKEKLGFDDAFNYKEEADLKSALKRYFPGGIDIYFDNVGGEMLEAAVANMNIFGRVAVCGAISEYTGGGRRAALEMLDVVYKRITIQGFLAADFLKCYADFISTTAEHLRAGKMQALCDVSDGVESVPCAFVGLFRGSNIGKKIVKIGDE